MTNRAKGRKKSNFVAATTVPDSSTLDFVSAGVNYKITYEDFITQLTGGLPTTSGALPAYADINLLSNTATTLMLAGTPTIISGTWAAGLISSFSYTTSGKLTYTRSKDFISKIDVDMEFSDSDFASTEYTIEIYKNGVATGVKTGISVDSGLNYRTSFSGLVACSYNDYLELYISCPLERTITAANCTFVVNDFVTDPGYLGQLIPLGGITGSPVLDTQGSVSGIRNIEVGSGLSVAIGAADTVLVSLDAHATGSGTPVLSTGNKVRLIRSGSGISLALDGDDIVVTATGSSTIQAGITAFATGGQPNATELTKEINQISVCAAAGDSVKLPTAVAGLNVKVINNGAEIMDLFPNSGDFIGQGAVDIAISIGVNNTVELIAYNASNWELI